MRKEKKKSATVYVAALVFLTCYVVQMVNCYRLKKSERREERAAVNAAKGAGVRQGSVVFGRVFGRTGKTNSHAFVEDKSNYQSDFAGWSKGQTHDSSSREAAWKRLASSLQCSGAHMLFRAVGPGASRFSLEQGGAPPIPLSQVPSTCGYSMHRDPLALVMMVPYEGCNILQEGENYVLPLRWQGIPVSLWCPKPATPAAMTVSQTPENLGPVVGLEPTTAATTTTKPDTSTFPQYPYLFPFYSYYPFFPPPFPVTTAAPSTTTAEPTTTSTTTTTVDTAAAGPAQMYPFPFNSPQYAPFNWPFPGPFAAAAEPTITQTNMTAPWSLQFPQYIPFYRQRLPSPLFPHYRQYPVQMPEMIRWPRPYPMPYYQHFHDRIPA